MCPTVIVLILSQLLVCCRHNDYSGLVFMCMVYMQLPVLYVTVGGEGIANMHHFFNIGCLAYACN